MVFTIFDKYKANGSVAIVPGGAYLPEHLVRRIYQYDIYDRRLYKMFYNNFAPYKCIKLNTRDYLRMQTLKCAIVTKMPNMCIVKIQAAEICVSSAIVLLRFILGLTLKI